ncbi:LysR substrate-binding domain-containing protein [Mangrovicoccus ximenensis]|uniref:LysR substrate-binding domain-containing protein n=1 Tax=Mangrovicoccus ximenensis TaxID=1911570 RepID=UPI00137514A3|nr:LysR substrate-binding domain-containing protein [Mangrovicoccus ximenensis]
MWWWSDPGGGLGQAQPCGHRGAAAARRAALAEGRIDAALIVAPPGDSPAQMRFLPLRQEPLVLLAPPGMEDLPPEEVFARLPLIAYDPQSWGGRIAERYLADRELAPQRLCALDGLEAISALVKSGAGASVVPDWPGLEGARPLPDGHLHARRIVAALPLRSEAASSAASSSRASRPPKPRSPPWRRQSPDCRRPRSTKTPAPRSIPGPRPAAPIRCGR